MNARLKSGLAAVYRAREFRSWRTLGLVLTLLLFGPVAFADHTDSEFTIFPVEVLTPQVREAGISDPAPVSIPPDVLAPFTGHPLLMEEVEGSEVGRVLVGLDGEILFGQFSRLLAQGLPSSQSGLYSVFRPDQPLIDPESRETLGVAARFLGVAKIDERGEVATLTVVSSKEEISIGDRLVPYMEVEALPVITPSSSSASITAHVISTLSAVGGVGSYSVVMISAGERDGLAPGDMLAVQSPERQLLLTEKEPLPARANGTCQPQYGAERSTSARILGCQDRVPSGRELKGSSSEVIDLPKTASGELLIFRVFEKVSFALVQNATRAIHSGDYVFNPAG